MKHTKESFLKKVTVNEVTGCWEWGTTGRYRYASIEVEKDKWVKAHRVSFMLFKGEIPEGLWVLHKCDNPPCVNPDHLFVGTRSDNMKDCYRKGRSKNTFQKGSNYWIKLKQGVL